MSPQRGLHQGNEPLRGWFRAGMAGNAFGPWAKPWFGGYLPAPLLNRAGIHYKCTDPFGI